MYQFLSADRFVDSPTCHFSSETTRAYLLPVDDVTVLFRKMAYRGKNTSHMGVLEFADQSDFFTTDRWWVQYPVIYDIFSRLNRCNSFSRYRASLADCSDRRSQKIDDLPVLATCQSGTSTMFSSKFNGPIAHGSTQ